MTWHTLYRLSACAPPATYAVMAVAAGGDRHWREMVLAVLFAASNAVIFWR